MAGTTINPYRFKGQLGHRRDGTNRNYVRARFLDTSRGIWLSQDPLGGAISGFNFYWYVKNLAPNRIDPTGLLDSCSYCGPDISLTLRHTMTKVNLNFLKYSIIPGVRALLCTLMFDPGDGWDITSLHNSYDWIIRQVPKCSTCYDKNERVFPSVSVTIDGKCYHPWTVNYILWGRACLLCGVTYGEALGTATFWKVGAYHGEDVKGAVLWTTAGYFGWPAFPTPQETNVWGDCKPCPNVWPAYDFPIHWKPLFWGALNGPPTVF